MRVLPQGDHAVAIAEQPCVAAPHPLGFLFGPRPLLVDVLGRVDPCLGLPLERDVRPRLMRVAGQEQPLADPEAGVVGRQGVRGTGELVEGAHRS